MTNSERVLIVGCGAIGNEVGIKLHQNDCIVYGIRRHTKRIATCISPLSIDLNLPPDLTWKKLPQVDKILISLRPNKSSAKGYTQCYLTNVQKIVKHYADQSVKFYFLSSTAIYGDEQGEVNVNSPIKPNRWNGEILAEAEQFLLSHAPTTIINSAGIYGMMRWWLFDYINGKKTPSLNWNKISNRIHQQDLINFIAQLMLSKETHAAQHKRYILCDDYSCPYYEIINWLDERQFPISEKIKSMSDNLQRQSLSQYKKCHNNIRDLSGFTLQYSTYKEGLAEQLKCWLGWQRITPFQQKVLYEVAEIPWGKTTSYRQIGDNINSRAYRAIGQALKRNPCAPWIPCHRVIASDGSIGGFMGEKGGSAIDEKRKLLSQENVIL